MFPGFAFLFGLGSLFVSSCNAKPAAVPLDADIETLKQFLRKCDQECVCRKQGDIWNVHPDYLAEIKDKYDLPQRFTEYFPYTYFDLASCKGTCAAEERCEYFRWRCKKEDIAFDYATTLEYCYSFGPMWRRCFRQRENS